MGSTSIGCEGLEAAVLRLAAGFFLDFPAVRLGAAVTLDSSFEAWVSPFWRSLYAAQGPPRPAEEGD